MWDQWEYHIEPVSTNSTPNERIIARLDQLGQDRWEMVMAFPSPHHLLFKRKCGMKST